VKFLESRIPGAYIIDVEPIADDRGFFARSWCAEEFRDHGLNPALLQCNISFNPKRGTLRGMHYQAPPHQEAKLVRCTRGSIFDVIIDLRPESPTYHSWDAATLTLDNRRMLYVPEGCAHGFQTLEPDTEVFYQMTASHDPASAAGIRWNDPAFRIQWPLPNPIVSTRDGNFPDFQEVRN